MLRASMARYDSSSRSRSSSFVEFKSRYDSNEVELLAERLSKLFNGPEAQLVEGRLEELLLKAGQRKAEGPSLDDCLGDNKACLVCMTPRSGSTYLSTLMDSTGKLGRCLEFLNFEDIQLRNHSESFVCLTDYLKHVIGQYSSCTGVFSMKGDLYHYLPLIKKSLIRRGLKQVFFVYLTREDLLAQAVSAFRAIQTGQWSSQQASRGEPQFEAEGILEQLDALLRMMTRWELLFGLLEIKPIRLTYETLVAQPTTSVQRLASALGVNVDCTLSSPLKIQRDELSAEWTDRIREAACSYLKDAKPFRRRRGRWWNRRPEITTW